MKLYRYEKYVMAKPMSHCDAEQELGHKIPNLFYGQEGYLIQDIESKEQKWVPKSVFEKGNTLCDSTEDKINCSLEDIQTLLKWIGIYAKENSPLGNKRMKLFVIKKHIDSLVSGLHKLTAQ